MKDSGVSLLGPEKPIDEESHHEDPSSSLQKPKAEYRDLWAAALFAVNVLTIFIVAVSYHPTSEHSHDNDLTSHQVRVLLGGFALMIVLGAVFAFIWQLLMIHFSSGIISCMLWTMPIILLFACVVYFSVGYIAAGIVLLVMTLVSICYARAVRHRIPFAAANLKAASLGIKAFSPEISMVAGVGILLQFVWIIMWGAAFVGLIQARAANGFVVFLMLVSLYWGAMVVKNTIHVVASGCIASWWFGVDSSRTQIVKDSVRRACTTSFGSICFGSLIVAILQAIRVMLDSAREKARERNDGYSGCILCCAEYLLRLIERLVEYFNRWAYVYVAIYGYDFRTSGKEVTKLFSNLGWTAVINDDLISHALALGCLVTGALVGLIGFGYAEGQSFSHGAIILGGLGIFIGYSMAAILMSLIDSAVATIFVCFAENPKAFESSNPQAYVDLHQAWMSVHGDALVASGYA